MIRRTEMRWRQNFSLTGSVGQKPHFVDFAPEIKADTINGASSSISTANKLNIHYKREEKEPSPRLPKHYIAPTKSVFWCTQKPTLLFKKHPKMIEEKHRN
ncbi:hypothetical protein ACJMK2_005984 [Sinanodonta woodiana]|uniref:Uncharacterized protein n=1 Tax=Sinanodonta woodiana TaxID=1069815 RepID=A0ABD3VTD4_SINWO